MDNRTVNKVLELKAQMELNRAKLEALEAEYLIFAVEASTRPTLESDLHTLQSIAQRQAEYITAMEEATNALAYLSGADYAASHMAAHFQTDTVALLAQWGDPVNAAKDFAFALN
jgi:hypothetical protein